MKKFAFLLFAILFTFPTFAVGTLEVSQFAHSGRVPRNGVRIPFITINATAQHDDVKIFEITVRRRGLSEPDDFERLIAITKNYKRSMNGHINNDNLARLRFRKPLLVEKDKTEKITVYGNLNFNVSGRTLFFTLEEIQSDAESFFLKSTPRIFTPPKTRQTSFVPQSQAKHAFRIRCRNRKCVRVLRK
jgi:hypothetical protein